MKSFLCLIKQSELDHDYSFFNRKKESFARNNMPTIYNFRFQKEKFFCKIWLNLNGKYHNVHGPSIICWNNKEEYYLNGFVYFKEQWKIERLKWL